MNTERLREWVRRDRIRYDSAVLPPRPLRAGGPRFSDDSYFLASARQEARRLVRDAALARESSVLDVGCGMGRLPIGILCEVGDVEVYRGVDVNERCVRWCRRYIERAHPTFQFVWIDVKNQRYNPNGQALSPDFRLPFMDRSFSLVYLYSVFSHMLDADLRAYLREFRRLLAPDGTLFFTAYSEEGVPDVEVNPVGYRRAWSGPLHCVRYRRGFLESLLAVSGFATRRFDYGTETDGQCAFTVTRTPESSRA